MQKYFKLTFQITGGRTSLPVNPQADQFTHEKHIHRLQRWDEQKEFGIALHAENINS